MIKFFKLKSINIKMPNTIYITSQVEDSINDMCLDIATKTIDVLSEKYSFDKNEAMELIKTNGIISSQKTNNKKVKKESKEDKPKRPKSGYLLFGDAVREEVKKDLNEKCEEGEKVKQTDVMKEIARRWKELSDEEKSKFNNKTETPKDETPENLEPPKLEEPLETLQPLPTKPKAKNQKKPGHLGSSGATLSYSCEVPK